MTNLEKMLDMLPQSKTYQDGEEKVKCDLVIFYNKKRKTKWTVGYYSCEHDYFLMCGYGVSIEEAIKHLQRQI